MERIIDLTGEFLGRLRGLGRGRLVAITAVVVVTAAAVAIAIADGGSSEAGPEASTPALLPPAGKATPQPGPAEARRDGDRKRHRADERPDGRVPGDSEPERRGGSSDALDEGGGGNGDAQQQDTGQQEAGEESNLQDSIDELAGGGADNIGSDQEIPPASAQPLDGGEASEAQSPQAGQTSVEQGLTSGG
jgi:hypothetical protein